MNVDALKDGVLGLFKKKDAPAPPTENPYLNARRAWNSHVAGLMEALHIWQAIGLIALLIVLIAVGGMVHIGSQTKFVPYVVEVDKLGRAASVAPADRARDADPRIVRASVAAFISAARMVTPDVALQRDAIFRVYAMLKPNDPATTKMADWYNGKPDANPFKRAAKESVNVEILSAMPQTPETWQIDWTETVTDRQGSQVGAPTSMRALVTVYIEAPDRDTTEEQMRRNPIGVYVRDYTWARQ